MSREEITREEFEERVAILMVPLRTPVTPATRWWLHTSGMTRNWGLPELEMHGVSAREIDRCVRELNHWGWYCVVHAPILHGQTALDDQQTPPVVYKFTRSRRRFWRKNRPCLHLTPVAVSFSCACCGSDRHHGGVQTTLRLAEDDGNA